MKIIITMAKKYIFSLLQFFIKSFYVWPKKSWFYFWFTRDDNFPILSRNKLSLSLHTKRFRDKIVDGAMAFECFVEKQYKETEILVPGDIVIDVGSHIGSFTISAAQLIGGKEKTGGRVIAYEPDRENYDMLCANIAKNNFRNCTTFLCAVAGETAKAREFFRNPISNARHSLYNSVGEKEMVRTVSLADVFNINKIHHCHFLKMDCEGAEHEIIAAAGEDVLKRIGFIALEYHLPPLFGLDSKKHSLSNLIKILENAGFVVSVKPRDSALGLIYARREK